LHTLRAGPIPTVIESFQIDRSEQALSEPITVSSGRHRFELSFAGLSFLDTQRAQYRYRLEGYESNWLYAGSEQRAVFSDLRPGRYEFQVQGGTGASFGQSTRIKFEVLPQFWERFWFWPSVLGGFSMFALLALRTYSKQHKSRQMLLEKTVTERTTELRERNAALAKSDQEKSALLQTIQMQAEAFARQAREDSLTGLPNRRFFDQRCAQAFGAARASKSHLTVALADIDLFKQVNDAYSHQVGDQVIRAIAQTIALHIQPIGLAARFGGEEFALFFHDLSMAQAQVVCERLRADVAALRFDSAPALVVTISIGLTNAPNAENFERALMRADELLYLAKHRGRNCVCADTQLS
jgi:diguanylate cyclase (GGDEF)-like protein